MWVYVKGTKEKQEFGEIIDTPEEISLEEFKMQGSNLMYTHPEPSFPNKGVPNTTAHQQRQAMQLL